MAVRCLVLHSTRLQTEARLHHKQGCAVSQQERKCMHSAGLKIFLCAHFYGYFFQDIDRNDSKSRENKKSGCFSWKIIYIMHNIHFALHCLQLIALYFLVLHNVLNTLICTCNLYFCISILHFLHFLFPCMLNHFTTMYHDMTNMNAWRLT